MPSDKVKKLAKDIEKLSPEGKQLVNMVLDATKTGQTVDVFAWANNLLNIKEELFVELFLVSKNNLPYRARLSKTVQDHINETFLDPILETLFEGAEFGMTVRHISYDTNDPGVLIREDLDKVPLAADLLDTIENKTDDVEYFSEEEHELKMMKGMIARVTHRSDRKLKFYITRSLEKNRIVSTGIAWQFDKDQIDVLQPKAAFKVPSDNETLLIGNDIFIFNQSKFEKMFNYEWAKLNKADIKAKEFAKKFRINVSSNMTGIESFFRESKPLLNKFLKTDIKSVDQSKVMDVANDMGLDLMESDDGAVILQDKTDLNKVLDIINDNYFEGHTTGNLYVAGSKRKVKES